MFFTVQLTGFNIHVDKDGADTVTAECVQGETACLTVNYAAYALSSLQGQKSDQPAIEILVSSPQKFNCEGIIYTTSSLQT